MLGSNNFFNPFQLFFDFFGSLFGGASAPSDATPPAADNSTMRWTHDGRIETVTPDAPPVTSPRWEDLADGSLAQAQRQANGPSMAPRNDLPPAPSKPRKIKGPGYIGKGKLGTWVQTNSLWKSLDEHERVAAMGMMEINDKADFDAARNVSATIVNRARQRGYDLGTLASSRWYQPTFEKAQERALPALLKSETFQKVLSWVKRYDGGYEVDPTNGSTHYLAHAKEMYDLYRGNPKKYPISKWGRWSKFNEKLGDYENKLHQDRSHAFVAPDPIGRFSVAYQGKMQDRLVVDPPLPERNPAFHPNMGFEDPDQFNIED